MQLYRILLICLALAFGGEVLAQDEAQDEPAAKTLPQLPVWEALDFEEKAFWATAKARISIPNPPENATSWKLNGAGSVQNTYELVSMEFDPATCQLVTRERLSRGRREQRHKSWDYHDGYIVRKRRNPDVSVQGNPSEWPVNHARRVYYPKRGDNLPVTNEYLLLLLAGRLAGEGPGASEDVLVHTDLNFFWVRLTVVPGKRINRDYAVTGGKQVRGPVDSIAVTIRMRPEGRQEEKPDFSLLGLHGDITLYFDKNTGLPLLLHGDAPRLGTADIHLRGMTPRKALQ